MKGSDHSGFVAAAALQLGLDIAPFEAGVLRFFTLAADMNAVVDAYPLGPHDESIETFVPR